MGAEVFGRRIDCDGGICGRPGEILGPLTEMCIDRISVNVIPMGLVVAWIFDAVKREALFPNRHLGFQAEGEASFDVLSGLLDGDIGGGGEKEMEVVGHENESVDLVAAFGAVVVEEVQE